MEPEEQRKRILDQFTRQAIPFAQIPAHSADESNRLVMDTAEIGPEDSVLDVACGPGLITCVAAERARHVTGIDLTPAMISQAEKLQKEKGLTNLRWLVGDVASLAFPDGSFSKVITRYSFHHLVDPQAVLREMVRVCEPGGIVCVTDVYTVSPEQAAVYDQVERLRDPSHVRALGLEELGRLLVDVGLVDIRTAFYKVPMEVERLLASSFPNEGDADKVRAIFRADLGVNCLGVGAEEREGAIHFGFPIVVYAGRKPA